MLQTQAYCIQCTVDFFTNQNPTDYSKHTYIISQKMIDFKHLFEQIISISIQFRNVYDELLLEYHNQQLNVVLEQDEITHTLSSDNKIVITPIKQQQLYPTGTLPPKSAKKSSLKYYSTIAKSLYDIVLTYEDLTITLAKHIQRTNTSYDAVDVVVDDEGGGDILTIIQNFTLIMTTEEVFGSENKSDLPSLSSTSLVLKLEFLLVVLDTLVNISIYQIHEEKTNFHQQLLSFASASSATLTVMLDALKSIKTEFSYIITHLKQLHMSQMIEYLPDLVGHFQLLLSCFHFNKINNRQTTIQQMMFNFTNMTNSLSIFKLLQSFIRKINANLFSANTDLSVVVCSMKYFPAMLFSNMTTTLTINNDSHFNSMKLLREQFQSLVDRYWMLLISPHNSSIELLQQVTYSTKRTPSSSSSTIEPQHMIDFITWKQRVHELRKIITLKLVNDDIAKSILGKNTLTNENAYIETSMQNHTKLLNELELKRDELQYAIRKCTELQEKVENYEKFIQTNNNNTQNVIMVS